MILMMASAAVFGAGIGHGGEYVQIGFLLYSVGFLCCYPSLFGDDDSCCTCQHGE